MKTLHYHLYEKGRIGMCNLLMSVECAIAVALLTKRDKIVFYGTNNLFNTTNGKNLFTLYDIKFPYELSTLEAPNEQILSLPADFHNTVLYFGTERPTADFINGRSHVVNLDDYTDFADFRTLNTMTLAFYSYLFYFGSRRGEIVESIKDMVQPKQQYKSIAQSYVDAIKKQHESGYNSLHIRRGDYLQTVNRNKDVSGPEITANVGDEFPPQEMLVVHTDEKDMTYFATLKARNPNAWFVDEHIAKAYPTMDTTEIGLISLLIASHSKNFVGTWFSTFTSYIQRYRLYNGLQEEFKFAYTQDLNYPLTKCKFKSRSWGETSWNRAELPERLKNPSHWINEWAECYTAPVGTIAEQSLRIFPKFITNEECAYIMSKMKYEEKEFYQRETRNRTVIPIRGDAILEAMVKRSCEALNYDYDCIENHIQLFWQFEGGQTYTHVDSIQSDAQGKRIASVLYYLNDGYEGSYIDFPYADVRIKPQVGQMIAYPLLNEFNEQDKLWTHSTSIITKGAKAMCYISLKQLPFKR